MEPHCAAQLRAWVRTHQRVRGCAIESRRVTLQRSPVPPPAAVVPGMERSRGAMGRGTGARTADTSARRQGGARHPIDRPDRDESRASTSTRSLARLLIVG